MVFAQQIPPGTVLPIMAGTALDSAKSKPGDKFTGKLMQDVMLPSGEKIRAGSRVEGQVVESSSPGGSTGARLVVRFDRPDSVPRHNPIVLRLRSLAPLNARSHPPLPLSTFDEYGIDQRLDHRSTGRRGG